MKPFFSIIICTYNRARLLPRAIDSALAQTEADWEIIVVDDGSNDQTAELVDRYSNRCSKIRLFRHTVNEGLSAARNTGIRHSKGRYITFLDSDDEYRPDHLANRKRILLRSPETQLLFGGATVIGNPYVVDKDNPRKQVHIDRCALGGTFFIRRDLFDQIGLFLDLEYAEDAEFLKRAVASGANVAQTRSRSYKYYRNVSGQLTKEYAKLSKRMSMTNSPIENWIRSLSWWFKRKQSGY